MSGKQAKAERRAARIEAEKLPPPRQLWKSWQGGAVGVAIALVVGASFVVPKLVNGDSSSTAASHARMATMSVEPGKGLPAGASVPDFSEANVETGQPISSTTLFRQKALLFFSEGVMCQACFQQIKGLEEMGSQLTKRGIRLVSITPDSPADLRQAMAQYGIASAMIADDNRDMSDAFNTLGLGMHSDTPGHAFALIDHGKVLWYRDYWLPPDRTMYVDPEEVLADLPA
jgi:peroxiredoxin